MPPSVPPPNFSVPPPGFMPPSMGGPAQNQGDPGLQELWVETKTAEGKVGALYDTISSWSLCQLVCCSTGANLYVTL